MRRFSQPSKVVVIAMLVCSMFFGLTNWFRQVNLLTAQFDMGNMDQVLWHSLHGQWFKMTSPVYGGVVQSRTSIHADFLLLAYVPFYAVWPDPRVPLVLQVLAVASGAIPLFWLARKRLGPTIGAFLAVLYLLYPPLEWAMTFDVHAVVLVMPLLLWAWWAIQERRWWIYGLTSGLAIMGKEEVGLVVAAMGIYWLFRPGHRRAAAVSFFVGAVWSIVMVSWAIPQARQESGHFALGFFSDFGDSYTSILRNMITHPWLVIQTAFGGQGLTLLRALFLPLAFIPLLGWPVLLIVVTEFAINLLTNNPNQQTIFFQYMSVIVPFMFIATIDGWDRIHRWLEIHHGRWTSLQLRRVGVTIAFVAAVVGIWAWSPLPGTRHNQEAFNAFRSSPYTADVRKVQALIKPTDRVATTNNLGPQFSRRDMIWAFPNTLDQANAVVVLEGGDFDVTPKEQVRAAVDALVVDPAWTTIYHREAFWYFRRVDS